MSLPRLELPFPDKTSTFAGSAFDPAFGDAKTRVGFRAVDVAGRPVTSFLEVTFPTADPAELGTGKYQLSAGMNTAFSMSPGSPSFGSPAQSFSIQVQQVVSFAGDQSRNDINQTKFELTWRDAWAAGHYAKATAKPVIDWVGDGQTGAVLELEGGWGPRPPLDPGLHGRRAAVGQGRAEHVRDAGRAQGRPAFLRATCAVDRRRRAD